MARAQQALQVPGEAESIPGASQPGDPDDPVAIAELRERQLQGQAIAEAASEGREADLAPIPAGLGQGAGKGGRNKLRAKARMADGSIVEVDIEKRQRDVQVDLYGPESKLPKGTAVRKDGTPCQGSERPYGIIGDMMTPQGRLVSRVVPFESLDVA
jgi:hypothetical protein